MIGQRRNDQPDRDLAGDIMVPEQNDIHGVRS
jgi:hypothetical protein